MRNPQGPTLEVRNLQTYFFTKGGIAKAVDGISFSVERGKVLGLVGESGSGKTVTGFSVLGLVDEPGRVVGGEILYHGENLVTASADRMRALRGANIAMIFQDPMTSLNPVMSIGEQIAEAFAPMSVTMTLQDEIDTSRGDMIVRENNVPEIGQDLEVLVTWMSSNPLRPRTKVVIKHTTNECMAMVKELKYKIDINTLHRMQDIPTLDMNDIGRISLRTAKPLFYDVYKKNRQTGSIIIIDEQTNETIGAGMII